MTREQFDANFQETLDTLLRTLAEHPEIDPSKFYSLACMLENLAFFSPVLYEAIQNAKNSPLK